MYRAELHVKAQQLKSKQAQQGTMGLSQSHSALPHSSANGVQNASSMASSGIDASTYSLRGSHATPKVARDFVAWQESLQFEDQIAESRKSERRRIRHAQVNIYTEDDNVLSAVEFGRTGGGEIILY